MPRDKRYILLNRRTQMVSEFVFDLRVDADEMRALMGKDWVVVEMKREMSR